MSKFAANCVFLSLKGDTINKIQLKFNV